MNDILARRHIELLAQFSWAHVLLAFDYDGTLAPIVREPSHALLRAMTRRRLQQLAKLYPVAVISGRSRDDVCGRLAGVDVKDVVGNHGIEPWAGEPQFIDNVSGWRVRFEAALAKFQGVWIEDKTYSLAIHYRRSRAKKRARTAIAQLLRPLSGVRAIGGKDVVNILPEGAPHKGVALEKIRTRHGCDVAIYVGDDETDEDVFALDQPGQLLSIRVGRKPTSKAGYYIRDQRAIDTLLSTLISLRLDRKQGKRPHRNEKLQKSVGQR